MAQVSEVLLSFPYEVDFQGGQKSLHDPPCQPRELAWFSTRKLSIGSNADFSRYEERQSVNTSFILIL